MKKLTIAASLHTCAMLPAYSAPAADASPVPQIGTPLAGTWTLIEAPEIHADGSRGDTFGPRPKGVLMIDADGRYALQIYSSDRPRFASGDKRRATDDEYRAAVVGMSAHSGHCFLDREHGLIVFKIEAASFPNWEGIEQKRKYELNGDQLTYQVPAAASGNGTTTISSWRKVR